MITEAEVKTILDQHTWLHFGGYGLPSDRTKTVAERSHSVKVGRAHLLEPRSVEQIQKTCEWIKTNLEPQKTVNYRRTSYGLKHIVEKTTGYISNGQFIVAALICGYTMGRKPDWGYNPSFNIKELSVKRAEKQVGMS